MCSLTRSSGWSSWRLAAGPKCSGRRRHNHIILLLFFLLFVWRFSSSDNLIVTACHGAASESVYLWFGSGRINFVNSDPDSGWTQKLAKKQSKAKIINYNKDSLCTGIVVLGVPFIYSVSVQVNGRMWQNNSDPNLSIDPDSKSLLQEFVQINKKNEFYKNLYEKLVN